MSDIDEVVHAGSIQEMLDEAFYRANDAPDQVRYDSEDVHFSESSGAKLVHGTATAYWDRGRGNHEKFEFEIHAGSRKGDYVFDRLDAHIDFKGVGDDA